MADVLIVCVREDEPQAKALAEMFEAAGFSIGGAPAGDGALRSSGAGLVVWSQASIRSRPFLDAAQRVINADKAVVASLIEPPPPSSIGNSPVFDLSNWDGDPNDPALDPLFFAVDRMVNSARAAVGANTARAAEPEPYEPPVPRREPPPAARREAPLPPTRPAPRAAAPPPSYSQQRPAPAEALGSEAEHWRAIRDSRDPADFMDYLSRYGPEGAFAEVAELRLKQLTSRSDPPRPAPRAPPPPPRQQAARPPVRLDPPPQRREAPPPQLRRPDPPRRTPPSYDRADLHEPPKGEGGALRAFVLIALLGGAALAGGLYFGGGIPNFGAPSQSSDAASTTPPPSAPTSQEPSDGLDQPVGVPVDEAIARATTRATATPPRDTARPTQTPPSRTQTASSRTNDDTVTPAPSASWAGAPQTNSGPVSLRPNESASTPAPVASVVPPPVQGPSLDAPNTAVASATPPPRVAPPGIVQWSQRPTARRVADLYPERAARQGVGGRVTLDCAVRSDLGLSCAVLGESPAELGFGRAALTAATSYRAMPTLSNGATAVGAHTRLVLQFQAPSQQ